MKTPPPLRLAIPLSLAALSIVLTGILAIHNRITSTRRIEELTLRRAASLGYIVVPSLERALRRGDGAFAEDQVSRLTQSPQMSLAMVCDNTNGVLYAAGPFLRGRRTGEMPALARPLVELARSTMAAQTRFSADSSSVQAAFPFHLEPPAPELRPSRVAVLYLQLDLAQPKRNAIMDIAQRALLVGAATALACFLAWLYLWSAFTSHLERLVKAVAAYASGTGELQVPAGGPGELAQIGQVLNRLFADLSAERAALRESESNFTRVFEHAPVLMGLTDLETGRFIEVNAEAVRVSGFSREEIIGAASTEIGWVAAEDRQRLASILKERGRVDGIDIRLYAKGGRALECLYIGEIVTFAGKQRVLSIVQVITERKRMEDELRESEEQYRALFENMHSGFLLLEVICNSEGRPTGHRLLQANAQFEAQTGLKRSEQVGRSSPDLDIQWPEDVAQRYYQIAFGAEPIHWERFNEYLGRYYDVRAFCPRKGQAALLFNEITERKQAELALEQARSNLTALLESTSDLIWSVDAQFRMLTWNQAFAAFARQYRGIEVHAGLPLEDGLPADVADFWRAHYQRALDRGAFRIETGMPSGSVVEFSLNPILNGIERVGVAVFGKDITRRKRALDALAASESLYRALFEGASDAVFLCGVTPDGEPGRFTAVNHVAVQRLGYTEEEFRSMTAAGIDAGGWDEERRVAIETLRTRGHATFEMEHQAKDGRRIPVEISASLFDAAGEPCILAIARDITERKQAEADLRQSEERFRHLFEGAADGFFVHDLDGRIVDANQAACDSLGYTHEELLHLDLASIEVKLGPDSLRPYWGRVQSGQSITIEGMHRRKDGSTFPAEIHLALLTAGERPLIFGAARDITQRQRAEEALRLSERRLSLAVSGTAEAIWEWNLETGATYYSPQWYQMLGYANEQFPMTVDTWKALCHPEDLDRALDKTRATLASEEGTGYVSEFRMRHQNGSWVWIQGRGNVVERGAGGRPLTMAGTHANITKRKQAEEEIARLAAAIEQAAETIVITDAEGLIFYANPAFERTTGYSVAEAVGKNPRILRSGQHDAAFYRQMWDVLGRGEVWRGRLHNRRRDGTLYMEDATISPVRDGSGRIVNYIALKLDVTREAELQAQLVQAQKMESIGRLAGGVAHDFNNLLTVINGYSTLMLGGLKTGDPLRFRLEEIHKAGERAAALTRQLLAFSRKQVLQPCVLNLNQVVGGMQSMLRRLVGEDVDVEFSFTPLDPNVHADPHQLEQVIMNLAVNSKDAMPHGGHLIVETSVVERDEPYARKHPETRPGRYAMLAVSDTGMGMDEATRLRIFEPFFTTKGAGQGTGLGLSMVQGIVAQSGGTINVYSEPGNGTTFRIYLPAVSGAAAAASEVARPEDLRGNETILVVEDQEEVRNFSVSVLKAYGYRVIQAANAGEALLTGERERAHIHLLLTDVVMPLTGGKELAARLSKLRPDMRVLFMSGYTDSVVVHQGVLDEGAQFIQKPFSPEELAAKVRSVLRLRQPAARILLAYGDMQARPLMRAALEAAGYAVSEAGTEPRDEAGNRTADVVITDIPQPRQEAVILLEALRREMPTASIIALSAACGDRAAAAAEVPGAETVLASPVEANVLLSKVAEVLDRRKTPPGPPPVPPK